MLHYIVIVSLLALSCSALAIQDTSNDDAALLEKLSINVLEPGCNKLHGFTLKDFEFHDGTNIQSLFEGKKADYLFCVSKKIGMVNEDGSFSRNVLKLNYEYVSPRVRNIVLDNCSNRRGINPLQTFKLIYICAMEKVMEIRSNIEQKYHYKVSSWPESSAIKKHFLEISSLCADQRSATPLESIHKANVCLLQKTAEYENQLEHDYYKLINETSSDSP